MRPTAALSVVTQNPNDFLAEKIISSERLQVLIYSPLIDAHATEVLPRLAALPIGENNFIIKLD
jgi:hypothetical protein